MENDRFAGFVNLLDDAVFSYPVLPVAIKFTYQSDSKVWVFTQFYNSTPNFELNVLGQATKPLHEFP